MTSTHLRRRGDSLHAPSTDGRVRAAQLQAIFRFTPLTMFVNFANMVLVVRCLRHVANPWALGAWASLLAVVLLVALRGWVRGRGRTARATASEGAVRRSTMHAGLLACVWAIVPMIWFPSAGPEEQLVVATVMTGMVCAGGFALSTVPRAATAYIALMGAGTFVGIARWDGDYRLVLSCLLIAYSLVVWRSAVGTATLFADRFQAVADLELRREVIALLLAEFEENGSDWLFELDDKLRLTGHSARFGQVSQTPEATLTGRPLVDLLAPDSRDTFLARTALHRPFRALQVATADEQSPRWWSISASPILSDDGTLSGWRGVGSDTTDVKRAQDEIEWMARTDILTGLPNRTAFRDRAADALLLARSGGPPMAVGCLDLDHFKAVNDTLGHAAGDVLLREVASTLCEIAPDSVFAGRLGGDEFGLLFVGMPDVDATIALTERIVGALSRSYSIHGADARIGASAGIAIALEDGDDVDALMRNADLALYRSKEIARGTVTRYSGTLRREAESRRGLVDELALALTRREFVLHYQPIIDTRTGATVAFEALVRWQHPRRGLVAPDAFISVAESSGIIGPLGDWVLHEACREAMSWPGDIRVAVNLSPAQLGRSSLRQVVCDALSSSGLAPGRLELEITEALLLSHDQATVRFLSDMQLLGIGVALDDFGTGFSSLNYLTRYPVSKIKIDRSFVNGGASIAHRGAIIEAVTGLAHKLGIETTAEGVESNELLSWVTSLGCTQAQGYLISRPIPAVAVRAFLAGDRAAAHSGLRLVG